RRPVVLRAGPSLLVGPDNGLLAPAAEQLGGATEAYVLTNPEWRLPTVGATFHGRDIFAPAAAKLAAGAPASAAGPALPVAELVRLPPPELTVGAGELACTATYVDHYGNIQLAATAADLGRAGVVSGARVSIRSASTAATALVASTFGDVDVGELVVYTDSDGQLAIAQNAGDAAARFGVRTGDRIMVSVRI